MKLDDDQLLSILQKKEDDSASYVWGELGAAREACMREYYRLPYGNEEEGWSDIITSDVHDTIEWILPSLLRIFTSSDRAVAFDPQTAADIEPAEQATDACNYVFYKQNNGFMVLYTAFKDALIAKNCAVHWRKSEEESVSSRPFQGATQEMLAMILDQKDAEIEAATPSQAMDEFGQPVTMYSGRIKVTEKITKIKVEAFAPEDLLVDRLWTSPLLSDCPYVARVMRVTASDIRQMGFDVTSEELSGSDGSDYSSDSSFRLSRIGQGDASNLMQGGEEDDESLSEGWLRIEYVLVDYDGDGIAERREIIRLKNKILSNEVVSHVPIATASPIINPHRWDGESSAEEVSDIQKTHTELMRQTLNSTYLANMPRTKVLTDANWTPYANIDDLLDSRPGGIIRQRQSDAGQESVTPFVAGHSLNVMEYLATMRENRTGVTRYNQGIDANSLNKTATGISAIMTASQQRQELMARVFAETLLKPIFQGILKLLTDGSMEKLAFRLRDKFVEYDPNTWRDWYDMTINVGLGTGSPDAQVGKINNILQAQMGTLQMGLGQLVTPKNIYNAHAKMTEAAGFKNINDFWSDPDQPKQQQGPDPQMLTQQAQQMQQQMQAMGADLQKLSQENQSLKLQVQNKQGELQIAAGELQLKAHEIDAKAGSDQAKSQAEVIVAEIEAKSAEKIAAMETSVQQMANRLEMIQATMSAREPVSVNVGGPRKKTVAIQAPSGQTYTGVIEEEADDNG